MSIYIFKFIYTTHTPLTRDSTVFFVQGDTLKIIEDLTALRPTIFVSVPRLFNRIYDKITSGTTRLSCIEYLDASR